MRAAGTTGVFGGSTLGGPDLLGRFGRSAWAFFDAPGFADGAWAFAPSVAGLWSVSKIETISGPESMMIPSGRAETRAGSTTDRRLARYSVVM